MFVAAVALAMAFIVSPTTASAQLVSVNIDFPFVAAGKDMPAGTYFVEVTGAEEGGRVIVRGSGHSSGPMSVITQLARHDKDAEPEIVFDKLGNRYLLSEIWIPGKDGLCLLATNIPHQHAVVGGPTSRK